MKKNKIIIIVIASVLAAALVIAGIIFALTKAFTFNPDSGSSETYASSTIIDGSSSQSSEGNLQSSDDSISSAETSDNTESESSKQTGANTDNSSESTGSDSSSNTVSVISSDCTITAGTVSGSKGKIVKVPVSIAKNPGIMAMIFDIEYDSSLLKYSGYSEGNVLSDYEFSEGTDKITFLNVEQKNITKNGNLFFIEFEILSNKAQDCEIKLTVKDDSFCNYDEQLIKVESKNGKVTIK